MRILVADDHALFRDGIVSLLEAAGHHVVGQVGDGQAAVEAARSRNIDLILMDVMMPQMSGLEALRQIRADGCETPVVMLTVADDDTLFEAVRLRADGYLLKNLNADEFLEMLQALERGEAAMTRQTTARLMRGFADLTEACEVEVEILSAREAELLALVASGLSNRAIAQALFISENTVKYHMKSIMEKLGAQNRTEAVANALRLGLIRTEGDPATGGIAPVRRNASAAEV